MTTQDEFASVPERGGVSETDFIWERNSVLIGTLAGISKDVGPNNSMMYAVQQDDKQVAGVWGAYDLDQKLDGVEVGSRVRIEALGKKPTKGGRSVMEYSVKAIPPQNVKPTETVNVPLPEAVGGGEGKAIDLSEVPFGDDAPKA